MEKRKNYPILVLFSAFLLAFFTADLLTPDREKSEMENRVLAERPQLTWASLTAKEENRKYSALYEKYINDQFAGRDAWITLKSVSESALAKLENNGIVYGSGDRMFEKYLVTDDEGIDRNAEFIREFIEKYQEKSNFTVSIVPSSYEIYQEAVPKGLHNVGQKAYIADIYSRMPEAASTLDLFPVLEAYKAEENLYYRTDHHWTSEGAYYAYQAFAASRGLRAVNLETLRESAREIPGFYGTYYSKCKLFSTVPDTITAYGIPFTSLEIDGKQKPTLNNEAQWEERDKYAAFLWSNNGLTVLKSDNNLNHQEGETSRILVIKDSYGNCYSPLLTYSYDEVYVLDLRYLKGVGEIMDSVKFDDVLIQYNFMNFASDRNMAFLTY